MLRVKLGIDSPATIPMIATTTSSSVKVNPACEANHPPDLAADLTLLASPRSVSLAKTYPWHLNYMLSALLVADCNRTRSANKKRAQTR